MPDTTSPTFTQRLLVAAFTLLSHLPLRLLYCISDMGFVLTYYIVRYRRHIVRHNLTTSFPDKDEKWIKKIEKEFYRWFCDYFMEAVKLLTISNASTRGRTQHPDLDTTVTGNGYRAWAWP